MPMGEGLGSELLMESAMKEIPRWRITVTSSSHDPRISWEIGRWWGGGGGYTGHHTIRNTRLLDIIE